MCAFIPSNSCEPRTWQEPNTSFPWHIWPCLFLCFAFKYINYKGFGPNMVKLNRKNKGHKVGFWVCQCVWGIAKLVLLHPCKFGKEFWIVLFPLHKILKPIPWNDRNFSLVIKSMPKCNMKQPCNMILLEWSRRRWLPYLLQCFN